MGKNKRGLTCFDCKHCFVEDLFGELCCDIKNPNFRYELIPVNKYGHPFSKCKKFELDEDLYNEMY